MPLVQFFGSRSYYCLSDRPFKVCVCVCIAKGFDYWWGHFGVVVSFSNKLYSHCSSLPSFIIGDLVAKFQLKSSPPSCNFNLYSCTHVCTCMYICMYVCVYVCMYVCMHACMHVCMYVCMCVRACTFVYYSIPPMWAKLYILAFMWEMEVIKEHAYQYRL